MTFDWLDPRGVAMVARQKKDLIYETVVRQTLDRDARCEVRLAEDWVCGSKGGTSVRGKDDLSTHLGSGVAR